MQDVVPLQRRWIEILHMFLNVGNSWLGAMRAIVHHLFLPDCSRRDRLAYPADTWQVHHPIPKGPTATPAFREHGLDIEKALEDLHGPGVKRGLGAFHGGQLALIFSRSGLEKLFHETAVGKALYELEGDPEVATYVQGIRKILFAISGLRQEVFKPVPNMTRVQKHVRRFKKYSSRFCAVGVPKAYATRLKLYCHIIVQHLVPQMEELAGMGLSLAQMSSVGLEHNNRPVKRHLRKLRGGGRRRAFMAHKPLVQAFKRACARNHVGRMIWLQRLEAPKQQPRRRSTRRRSSTTTASPPQTRSP
jgi:hypothetical protein